MKRAGGFPVGLTEERHVNRRGFLHTAAATAMLAVTGEWIGRRLSGDTPPPREPLRAADLTQLAPGQAEVLTLWESSRHALLVRPDATSLVAFDRRCPHLGCPVLWSADRGRFECPCHAAAFDARTGRVLYGPPRRGLHPLAVEIRGTEVWLR